MTLIEVVYKNLVRPRIFAASRYDPELAHEWGLERLKRAQSNPFARSAVGRVLRYDHPALQTEFCGMRLRHPLGLAAGYDKNCQVYWGGVPMCNWAFVEVGGITRDEQTGNPRPRMWRSEQLQALGNAMGFNNCGRDKAGAELDARGHLVPRDFKVGLNVGKSKVTPLDQAAEEYADTVEALWRYVHFIVINPSSPNTPGLRQLQNRDRLNQLIAAVQGVNRKLSRLFQKPPLPVGVKPSPDESDEALADFIDVCLEQGVDFVVPTNTTVSREGIGLWLPVDRGGVSGPPLKERALRVQKEIYRAVKGRIRIIGVGGIASGRDLYERILAGADVCEALTAWPFEGPDFVKRCLKELAGCLRSDGFENVGQAVGRKL